MFTYLKNPQVAYLYVLYFNTVRKIAEETIFML